jgi:hypothetical protein
MKRAFITIYVAIMLLSSTARSSGGPHYYTFICPICNNLFKQMERYIGPSCEDDYSDERRYESHVCFSGRSIYSCPQCRFSGPWWVFKRTDSKLESEPPNAEQIKAIKIALAARTDRRPGKALFPAEYYDMARLCLSLSDPKPSEMRNMYLQCAWKCDDIGEDALGAMYRTKALAVSKQMCGEKPLELIEQFRRRILHSVIMHNFGKHAEALKGMTDLHVEIEQTINSHIKLLPPRPECLRTLFSKMPYTLRNPAEIKAYNADRSLELSGSSIDDGHLYDFPRPPLDPETRIKLRKEWDQWKDFAHLQDFSKSISYWHSLWLYKTLRATKAMSLAKKGGLSERLHFTERFCFSNDFRVIAGIKTFVAKPRGEHPKSPELDTEYHKYRHTCPVHFNGPMLDMLRSNEPSTELIRFIHSRNGGYGHTDKAAMTECMIEKASAKFLSRHLKDNHQHTYYNSGYSNRRNPSDKRYGMTKDIIVELIRRQDAEAAAALSGNFANNLSWYAEALDKNLRDDIFPETAIYFVDRDFTYADPYMTNEYFAPFYKAIARDPKQATAAASRLIYRTYTDEEISSNERVIGIMPLGYLKTEESRKLLVEAAGAEDGDMACAAAKCLLMRGDQAGKDAMINLIVTHRLWDLPHDRTCDMFIKMLTPKDAAILPKLKKLFLDDPEDTKLPEEERGQIPPFRLVAALSSVTPKQRGVYDAFLARLGIPSEESNPYGGVTRGTWEYDDIISLAHLARVCYHPDIGEHIVRLLGKHADNDQVAPKLIDALAESGATDQIQALTELLKRPTPFFIKDALIRASSKLNIPGMTEKLTDWQGSRDKQLAELAKMEIARRAQAQTSQR